MLAKMMASAPGVTEGAKVKVKRPEGPPARRHTL